MFQLSETPKRYFLVQTEPFFEDCYEQIEPTANRVAPPHDRQVDLSHPSSRLMSRYLVDFF